MRHSLCGGKWRGDKTLRTNSPNVTIQWSMFDRTKKQTYSLANETNSFLRRKTFHLVSVYCIEKAKKFFFFLPLEEKPVSFQRIAVPLLSFKIWLCYYSAAEVRRKPMKLQSRIK